jgi:hypothetical protein
MSAFENFLVAAANSFMPKPLYAINGGLGISDDFTDGTSPLTGVSLLTFFDNFDTDIVGTQPAIQAGDVGSWFATASQPASITVVSALGDLTSKPVVLNQGQGACSNCPVLQLIGTMANSSGVPADVGTYSVKFQSLEDKPSVKGAPVILQSSDGLEIARLSYSTESSQQLLRYNGLVVANWTQHVHQDFEITVNVDAKTTTLSINGSPVTGATNVPFVNLSATNLAKIAWIFGGIDAGIIAVDGVSITRFIDP